MKDSLQDYFRKEVQWLNGALMGFHQKHPEVAGQMQLDSVQDSNPSVARLLEGCAYLNARISQQIDLGAGLITESLVRRLAGSFLQPYPSKTMIECRHQAGRLENAVTLEAGIRLQSAAVGEEKTICQFETLHPLAIQPLSLISWGWKEESKQSSTLALNFKLNESADLFSIKKIPLYLNAERGLACEWLYSMLRDVDSISIKHPGHPPEKIGGQEKIQPFFIQESSALAMRTEKAFQARQMWLDYFLFREMFFQLELDLSDADLKHHQFSIDIEFRSIDPEQRLADDLFKLHCVPAANQFSMNAEPIRYHASQQVYPLVPAYDKKDSKRLLKINAVNGFRRAGKKSFPVDDFYQQKALPSNQSAYRLSQSRQDKDRIESSLSFSGLGDEDISLSCEITAFNGHYPHQYLSTYSLKSADKSVPSFLELSNLHRPVAAYQPPLNAFAYEQLLVQLQLDFSCLMNREQLVQLLKGFDLSHSHHQMIDAIKSIHPEPFHQVRRGRVERGIVMLLHVDERGFYSQAEVFLLGQLLHWFFKSYASLGTLIETKIICSPSNSELSWGSDD